MLNTVIFWTRPRFEKASVEKESVMKCYYDSRIHDRFQCCFSPLVVQLIEHETLFLDWSCCVLDLILSF